MRKIFIFMSSVIFLVLLAFFSYLYIGEGQLQKRNVAHVVDEYNSPIKNFRKKSYTGTNNPPLQYPPISPDNPIQPRLSSIQKADNPLANLTKFYNKEIVDQPEFPTALCNDGTKPVYYHKQGFGSGAKRWIIWLEGGGYCSSSDPTHPFWCGDRSEYMSSSNGTLDVLLDFEGMLKKSHTDNPDFYSYNMVLVHYCSSDLWTGSGERKIMNDVTGQKFWYSGSKIVQAVIHDLKNRKNLSEATNVIFSGTSAGAAGVNFNTEKVKEMLSPTTDMVSVIDALWIKSHNSVFYSSGTPDYERSDETGPIYLQDLFQYIKTEPHPRCLQAITPKCPINAKCARWDYTCVLPATTARYLSVPYYATHDAMDAIILWHYRTNVCELNDPLDYMPWYTQYTQDLAPTKNDTTGFFETSFGQHGVVPSNYWYKPSATLSDGRTISTKDSFGAWYFNRNNFPRKAFHVPNPDLYPHQQLKICPVSKSEDGDIRRISNKTPHYLSGDILISNKKMKRKILKRK